MAPDTSLTILIKFPFVLFTRKHPNQFHLTSKINGVNPISKIIPIQTQKNNQEQNTWKILPHFFILQFDVSLFPSFFGCSFSLQQQKAFSFNFPFPTQMHIVLSDKRKAVFPYFPSMLHAKTYKKMNSVIRRNCKIESFLCLVYCYAINNILDVLFACWEAFIFRFIFRYLVAENDQFRGKIE